MKVDTCITGTRMRLSQESLKREDGHLALEAIAATARGNNLFQSLKREDGHLAVNKGPGYINIGSPEFQSLKREDGHLAGVLFI